MMHMRPWRAVPFGPTSPWCGRASLHEASCRASGGAPAQRHRAVSSGGAAWAASRSAAGCVYCFRSPRGRAGERVGCTCIARSLARTLLAPPGLCEDGRHDAMRRHADARRAASCRAVLVFGLATSTLSDLAFSRRRASRGQDMHSVEYEGSPCKHRLAWLAGFLVLTCSTPCPGRSVACLNWCAARVRARACA